MLPYRSRVTFRYSKENVSKCQFNYVLAPSDKALNDVVISLRLYGVKTFKNELSHKTIYISPIFWKIFSPGSFLIVQYLKSGPDNRLANKYTAAIALYCICHIVAMLPRMQG